jgi:hypothetical protein
MYLRLRVKYPLFLSDFIQTWILFKLEFSRQIFEKYSNIRFHENQLIGSRVVPFGPTGTQTDGRTGRQTDSYDEANSGFSQFCESAYISLAPAGIRTTIRWSPCPYPRQYIEYTIPAVVWWSWAFKPDILVTFTGEKFMSFKKPLPAHRRVVSSQEDNSCEEDVCWHLNRIFQHFLTLTATEWLD